MTEGLPISRRSVVSNGSAAFSAAILAGCASPALSEPRARAIDPFAGRRAGDQKSLGGMALCWCPPGQFQMGSPPGEPDRRGDEQQVEVTLTRGFWIGRYSVTQGEWARVSGALPGELDAGAGANFPLYNANFPEAEAFCDRLAAQAHDAGTLPPGWTMRLPTEAQWEYACRAGTTTATAFGDSLSSRQANFRGDHPYNGAEIGPVLGRTERVGAYPANAWGLHDMHGNVFDWCRDWFHTRYPGGIDPDLSLARDTAARNGDDSISRSRRGGCWSDEGWPCRSAFRLKYEPERRATHIGLRVVAEPLA